MAKELRGLLYAASVGVETIDASFGGGGTAGQTAENHIGMERNSS